MFAANGRMRSYGFFGLDMGIAVWCAMNQSMAFGQQAGSYGNV